MRYLGYVPMAFFFLPISSLTIAINKLWFQNPKLLTAVTDRAAHVTPHFVTFTAAFRT